MNTKIGRFGFVIGALAAVMLVGAPAFADSHGGGGHGGGGGGHASGGHGSVGGHGAHGMSHGFGGGYARHSYGYGGGGGYARGYGHGGYGYGGYGHGGYWHGGYGHGGYWGGGYWHGGYWPRAWYGFGFAWFLPVLPLAYATYWWDGIPYYYANDVYYTWNPSYSGYVATDPPPLTEGDANPSGAPPSGPGPASDAAAGGQIFMYPKNGQSEAQQSTDRLECQQWASSQTGGGARADEFRRAMTACAEARGYGAK
ncbi:MAG: hypothetical protein ACHQIL_04545 [Steroidobacterales bacterium]